jgi:hypothetical protein
MATKKISSAVTVASGSLIVVLFLLFSSSVAFGQASHVRWDIISITPPPPPLTSESVINPGGVAFATADPFGLKIKFTGSGTFVAPPNGAMSGAVTGGGTWETFSDGVSTGSGTYQVTRLVDWEFATLQTLNPIDNIGGVRANGNAVLKIDYSDGSQGTLVVGCHGPGAPAGIFEGVTATKGFVTYWNPSVPPPNVDENRTLFHLQ